MAESTLSLTFAQLQVAVADYLGLGRTLANWSTDDTSRIDDIIKRGTQQFYLPPPIPGEKMSHQWTFMKPLTSIIVWATVTSATADVQGSPSTTLQSTVDAPFHASMIGKSFTFDTSGNSYEITAYASTSSVTITPILDAADSGQDFTITADGDYRLPDDVADIEGDMQFDLDDGFGPVKGVSQGIIKRLRARSDTTSHPEIYSIVPLTTDGVLGQRSDLMLYPEPDTDYTLHYSYIIMPDKLSASLYAYGASVHSDTLEASCLAMAELERDEGRGARWQLWIERLMASVAVDRKRVPDSFGRHGDGLSNRSRNLPDRNFDRIVTFNGIDYSEG